MKRNKEHSNTTRSPEGPYADFDSFEALFEQSRQRLDYWVEGAKNEFTEKTIRRMQELGISRTELAARLEKKQPQITKLLRGDNNFTIETMVQIAVALDCQIRCHLEPSECETRWVDVVKSRLEPLEIEPAQPISLEEFDDASISFAA